MSNIELSPEQIEDAQKMATKPDLPNFSLPGTGKTHTALEAMSLTGLQRHLIVCPPIAVHWWAQQAKEYLGGDVRIMKNGNSPLVGEILVTTFGLVRNAKDRLYEEFDGGTLTIDESHNVCNPSAKQTQAIYGPRCDLVGSLAERFDLVWNMSGTPKMNHANDYYTQAALLHPEYFEEIGVRDYDSFCRKFTYKQERQYNPRMRPQWKIVGSQNEVLLGEIIYKRIGAIRRREAPNLPKLRWRELEVPVKVTKEIREATKGLSPDEIFGRMNDPDDDTIRNAWRLSGLAKVPGIVPYVGDCIKDSPVLLGCWHHDVMDSYVEHFEKMGLRVEKVAGDVPSGKREGIRRAFNDGFIDVLVGQMRAMGVSWNLQEACSHVIIAEPNPVPGVIDQFFKRVYRRGQKQDCTVDMVLGDGLAIDHAFEELRKRKEASDARIG